VVSRGAWPEPTGARLALVAPTLLIVDERDAIFEDRGYLDAVARLASDWLSTYLAATTSRA
jgi:hypothetical protein